MQKTSTILITGASGMIGSALKRLLIQAGYNHVISPTHAELDLLNQPIVEHYFAQHKPEYVFHLAARVGGILANQSLPAEFIYQNTQMHTNVIHAAHKTGCKKLLFPGSACTYPKLAAQPIIEEVFLDGKIEPTNIAYAAAKINGIIMCQSYAKQYGLNIVVPMPTNTYGIGDNFDPQASHVIPALMTKIWHAKEENQSAIQLWGTGQPLREFIYVDDLAEAFIFLMQQPGSIDLINVGTMQEISIKELALVIANIMDYKGELQFDTSKPDGAPRKCLDSKKMFMLGWRPTTSLEDGLRKMFLHHFQSKVKN